MTWLTTLASSAVVVKAFDSLEIEDVGSMSGHGKLDFMGSSHFQNKMVVTLADLVKTLHDH